MRYLITGITGFVGPHLAKLLIDKGHDVVGLIRGSNGNEQNLERRIGSKNYDKLKFVYGDLLSETVIDNVFKEDKFDGVFHLAAQSHPPTSFKYPYLTLKTNCNGTVNIAEAIIKNQPKCRMMFCSTSEVYGICQGETPISEDYRIGPINPYGVSKACADLYVRERAKNGGYAFFVSRAFSHCGAGRGRNFSVSSDAYQLIRIKKKLQEPVVKVGNLESRRVVMDVRDCVRGYYLLMQKGEPGEAYNVAADRTELYSMGELLDKMARMLNLNVKKEVDQKLYRPIDIPIQVADTTKFKKLTDWRAEISIDEMLKSLLDYWESNV